MKSASRNRALALVAAWSAAFTQRAIALADKLGLHDAPIVASPRKSRDVRKSKQTTAQIKRAALKARNRAKHRSHCR